MFKSHKSYKIRKKILLNNVSSAEISSNRVEDF